MDCHDVDVFDGNVDNGEVPKEVSGVQVLEHLQNLGSVVFEKISRAKKMKRALA